MRPLSSFNVQDAILLAAISGQTYVQFYNPDGSFIVPTGYRKVADIEAKSFNPFMEKFGFIIESENTIIIAFRGTSSTSDWISDLRASQVRFKALDKHSCTHRGFTEIYNSARTSIKKQLLGLSPHKSLMVTGHSLGGALACLCAADLSCNTYYQEPVVYTFGAPRVGNPSFAEAYGKRIKQSYRVINPFDVVPLVPPTVLQLPRSERSYYYLHVSEAVSLPFQNGSIANNHVISSYYQALSKQDPMYTMKLCDSSPGLCPVDFFTILVEGILV
ncbi:lipase family protein [Paenibacillus sp. 1001270B_150601_E10]|uniref:lipase family protein n=1 Tax=Paenibacillus sp. 1001270B_150601_E10 TaxID=2787079 RepID=UPI00189CFFC9|nr:lipase family protein [Paenibacillus sp. 1001270B_150601_E10]